MTLAADIEVIRNYIGTDTETRVMLALARVANALETISETTTTELTTVDNTIPRFSGTAGVLQAGQTLEDDSGNVTVAAALTVTGAVGLGGDITFTAATATPTISQTLTATASATGAPLGLIAQVASGATSTGGAVFMQPGTGTSANGAAEIRSADATARIIVDTDGEITVVPNTVPNITGLTTDAALIQLLTALAGFGWITDNHVEA